MMLQVGFYQFRPIFGKVDRNLNKVINTLKRIQADIIVLPELAFTGYHFADRSELEQVAEDPAHSPTLSALTEVCRQKDLFVVTGFAEKDKDKIYNSAVLVGPQGLIHVYRKIQLFFREKEVFEPGNIPLQVQKVKGIKLGMMICFDWIFPEITRSLALQGADLICHPANLVLSYCQEAMKTRCLENGVFAITANRIGADRRPHGTLDFTGKSQIVVPKGDILHRAKLRREEIFITEIDPRQARDKKMTELNDLFQDRRPLYYKKICE
jgi:predicted amidohydrolase